MKIPLMLMVGIFAVGISFPAQDDMLLFDDFDDGDISSWLTYVPGWSESGGVLHGTNTWANVVSEAVFSLGFVWTDYSAEADVTPLGGYTPATTEIDLRYQSSYQSGPGHCRCGLLQSGYWAGNVLFLQIPPDDEAGDTWVMVPFDFAAGATYRLRATAQGQTVTCEVLGYPETKLTLTGNGIPSKGTVALRNTHIPADFDNLIVWDMRSPAIAGITAPVDPVLVNTPIQVSAAFSDSDILDTHTASWDWGDGTTSAGIVTESEGTGVITGSHTYLAAGVYPVRVIVTDNDGGTAEAVFEYVVVYDPAAEFVTGGGWIQSAAGAYVSDSTLSGKATFGFVSRYAKGATVPDGNTQFKFHVADLSFRSTSYQWLVVAGARAQFKGEGTVNGAGSYGFLLTAIDGALPGGGGEDRFRIKIWDRVSGQTVYDNQPGAGEDSDVSTAISGGNIVIHR